MRARVVKVAMLAVVLVVSGCVYYHHDHDWDRGYHRDSDYYHSYDNDRSEHDHKHKKDRGY